MTDPTQRLSDAALASAERRMEQIVANAELLPLAHNIAAIKLAIRRDSALIWTKAFVQWGKQHNDDLSNGELMTHACEIFRGREAVG